MDPVDIVVVVLCRAFGPLEGEWKGAHPDRNHAFEWQKLRNSTGFSVSFLGCMISFWGDIAGKFRSRSAELEQSAVYYLHR